MSSESCNLAKQTWLKVAFFVLFLIVNIALYAQSKYAFIEVILPHIGINISLTLNKNICNGNITNASSTLTPHNSVHTNSTNLNTVNLTTSAYLVQETKQMNPFIKVKIVNPHDFPYILTPNATCSNRKIELVICVAISHDNYEGRMVIRNTYGSYAYNVTNNALLVFFIGSKSQEVVNKSLTADIQRNVSIESSRYGDILHEDYIDCYNNLSLKSVSILKWVSSFCSNAKFILKVDDDMYVNIPFMVKTLRQFVSDDNNPDAFILGSVQENAHPIRSPSSKWYTPITMYPDSTYPKYVSGTAYAMTGKAAFLLFEASLRAHIFWLEDIYITGICAKKANVDVRNSGYFTYGKPTASGCTFRAHISGHRYSYQEILHIHKELYDPSLKC